MATLKAIVDHRKADGTYNVKIRLTHSRKSLYVPTELYVTERQLTRSKKIKDPHIISTTNSIIDEMRNAITALSISVEVMSCEQLRDAIRRKMSEGEAFRLDFFDFAYPYIERLGMRNGRSHISAVNWMKKMAGKIDINDITHGVIVKYREYLIDNGLHTNSVNSYLKKIKHIINAAKEEYNDDYSVCIRVNPFRSIAMESESTEHRVLSVEQVRRLTGIKCDRYEMFARDVFLLSFCLIGINLVDLYYMKKESLADGILTYSRQKTRNARKDKAIISVKVEHEAMTLIEKFKDSGSEYLFNFHRRYVNHEKMTRGVNDFLKRLKSYDKTLPPNLTYYYARHTWATIAYNDCGVDMQTIHEALNHASDANMKITDIYVKKDFSRIWDANRKVLDYVFGKEKKALE